MSEQPASKTPQLSIVVVSFNDLPTMELSISSLQQQKLPPDIEILIVRDWHIRRRLKDGMPVQSEGEKNIRSKFRSMRWIDAPKGCTVPKMRSLGLEESNGKIVAFIEDDCVVSGTWVRDLLAAHNAAPNVAIGGAVEPGSYTRAVDWGVFFCEYARFMRPLEGEVPWLPGNNVSYKKAKLLHLLGDDVSFEDGFYEVFVNSLLLQKGEKLLADDNFYVQNVNSWPLSQVTRVPFHHGRGFAAMRFTETQSLQKILYAYLALVLPVVQIYRIMKQVYLRQKYFIEIVKAMPIIVLFCTYWSAGEFTGYLMGPGKSLEEWR